MLPQLDKYPEFDPLEILINIIVKLIVVCNEVTCKGPERECQTEREPKKDSNNESFNVCYFFCREHSSAESISFSYSKVQKVWLRFEFT